MMIDLYSLIPEINAQIFSPTAEFVIPAETPINKTESEIETNTLKAEVKIRKFLKQFKALQMFMLFTHHIKC